MTTITILPETADSYRALAGDKESTGRTVGEALDALRSLLTGDESGTFVIVQSQQPDRFFGAAQQERLTELMQLRQSRSLAPEEETELESLVEAELDGARQRAERAVGIQRSRQVGELLSELTARNWEQSRQVGEALSKLTEHEKTLLMMWAMEMSAEEIAEALNEDVHSVRLELNKVRAKMRYRARNPSR